MRLGVKWVQLHGYKQQKWAMKQWRIQAKRSNNFLHQEETDTWCVISHPGVPEATRWFSFYSYSFICCHKLPLSFILGEYVKPRIFTQKNKRTEQPRSKKSPHVTSQTVKFIHSVQLLSVFYVLHEWKLQHTNVSEKVNLGILKYRIWSDLTLLVSHTLWLINFGILQFSYLIQGVK